MYKALVMLLFSGIFISCNQQPGNKVEKHKADSIAIDDSERAFYLIDSTNEYNRLQDSTNNSKK